MWQEQIAVRLFDQESCVRLQEGPGKPPVTAPHGPHHNTPPNLQELKMQVGLCRQQLWCLMGSDWAGEGRNRKRGVMRRGQCGVET